MELNNQATKEQSRLRSLVDWLFGYFSAASRRLLKFVKLICNDDLHHPGPLPKEREKRAPRFGKVVRRDWPDGLLKN